jgi:hypothetical protein
VNRLREQKYCRVVRVVMTVVMKINDSGHYVYTSGLMRKNIVCIATVMSLSEFKKTLQFIFYFHCGGCTEASLNKEWQIVKHTENPDDCQCNFLPSSVINNF